MLCNSNGTDKNYDENDDDQHLIPSKQLLNGNSIVSLQTRKKLNIVNMFSLTMHSSSTVAVHLLDWPLM